ncbi:O-antigen polysaccharide polymerase Wzy [Halobacterium salinarum]|uniref:O-antigen polysaccharide polymerase Wzy n=1 Tax=Halobacterium salinarum TaxID=2242 RepID=UPI001F17C982|nr:O-antigen polysaccharide polymerase Wzy [Halobacterium salinarum]MCF2165494.1 O-antigen polysaccharide polymerase Wzy [Halobacterium salinarum]MCF2166686.1 O-antigen polysaccharide polymerase Wzy [Halobacterium salinarum]
MSNIIQLFLLVSLLCLSILFLFRVWYYIRHQNDVFNPISLFALGTIYLYLVPGVYLYISDDFVWLTEVSKRDFLTASLVVFLFFALVVSSFLRLPKVKIRGINFNISRSDSRFLFFAGLLWIALGLTGYLLYVWLNGGFVRLLTVNRALFQTVPNTQRYKILAWVGLWGGLPLVVPSAHELYENIDGRQRRLFIYFVSILVLLVLVITFSFRGRLKAAYPMAYILLYLHYRIYKISFKQFGLIAALGAISIGGFTFIEYIIGGGNASLRLIINGLIYRVRFEPLVAVITEASIERPFQLGTTFINGGMWYDVGITPLGERIELIVTGEDLPGFTIGATVIAELYLNYGIVGVLLGAPIYGFLLKVIWSTLLESDNYIVKGIYPAMLFISLAIVPTSIGWVLRNFVMIVLPPIILTLAVRRVFSEDSSNSQLPS